MLKKLFVLFAASQLLFGCATTTQSISEHDKASIKSVVLSTDIPVPEKMSYLGPGGATGLMFGAIGAVVAAGPLENSRSEFQSNASGSEAMIRKIVTEEVLAQFKQSGKFPIGDKSSAGAATLECAVTNYGFSTPHAFSSKLVPILGIRCELKDASEHVLWSDTERVMPLGNPVDGVEAEVIQQNPDAREAAWRAAAQALAPKLIAAY